MACGTIDGSILANISTCLGIVVEGAATGVGVLSFLAVVGSWDSEEEWRLSINDGRMVVVTTKGG